MKNKTSIDIDLDVYKIIMQNIKYINEPANDVLKRLLIGDSEPISGNWKSNNSFSGGLTSKNVFLKSGMKLRKHFKGNLFEATVHDGYIEFNNKRYTSPSGAAVAAARGSVNGWRFWDFLDENEGKWKLLETLRR
jgi:hypothetical protein